MTQDKVRTEVPAEYHTGRPANQQQQGGLPANQEQRKQMIQVLQQSLYPGVKAESVEMILAYCESAKLDPFQKPVHPVPMSVKNPVTGDYEWRDVVMPGIGLYRIQADRSGDYAGISEPEFGPMVTETFQGEKGASLQFTFPEWCKVTAYKVVHGHIVGFTAKEYWLENYATAGKYTQIPNAMWKKRPRGQLSKCCEAQALRKGWPEIGAAPTAEEMEGKWEYVSTEPESNGSPPQAALDKPKEDDAPPVYPQEKIDNNKPKWQQAINEGRLSVPSLIAKLESTHTLTDEQKAELQELAPQEEPNGDH